MGKLEKLKHYNSESTRIIKKRAKEKIIHAKEDPKVPALIIVELIIILIVSAGIFVYLDPETNLVPFPWNLMGFLLLVLISAYLYKFTKLYRIDEKQKKKLKN